MKKKTALMLACDLLKELSGDCPLGMELEGFDGDEFGCEGRCRHPSPASECFELYFQRIKEEPQDENTIL